MTDPGKRTWTASLAVWGIPLTEYLPVAQAAERFGFEAVWLGDHLVTPLNPATPFPYSPDSGYTADTPWPDIWAVLSHIAAGTTTLTLASGVFVLPLRNVFAAAKSIATAQELSGGRVILGVGVGWLKDEFEAVGVPWTSRGRRAEEMIEVMTKLWTGEAVSHSGAFYEFDEVKMAPPTSRPPVVFGGTSEAAIKRAARCGDGWLSPSTWSTEDSARVSRAIAVDLEAAGRSRDEFKYHVRLNDPTPESLERALELGHEHFVTPVPATADVGLLHNRIAEIAEVMGLA